MEPEKDYLLAGLNALARAHQMNYFVDGHRGGAIISSVYLCREQVVDAGAREHIFGTIERTWMQSPLCAPFPEEEPSLKLLDRVIACMTANLPDLREAGHNLILPTLALKAFHEVPEAVTPARVEGVCRMVESFKRTPFLRDGPVGLPDFNDAAAAAEFALAEFIACTGRFLERGQGWSGHLLTYSRAMLDLTALGYREVVAQALDGYRQYIARIRSGPQEIDKERPEHLPLTASPLQAAYWQSRDGDYNLGHIFKYPYGFYGLLAEVPDVRLKRRCHEAAFRVF